jgi:hypothetical protein
MAAVETEGSFTIKGYIWTSNDYGVTWTKQSGSGARYWRSITISPAGAGSVLDFQSATNILNPCKKKETQVQFHDIE